MIQFMQKLYNNCTINKYRLYTTFLKTQYKLLKLSGKIMGNTI